MQVPPPNPAVGSTYIVAASPMGAWSAFAHHLAAFTQAGWRFIPPSAGLRTMIRTTGAMAVYRDGLWETGIVAGSKLVVDGEQVVGPRAAGISNPAGGTFIDAEAREAIFEILNRLRGHGLIA